MHENIAYTRRYPSRYYNVILSARSHLASRRSMKPVIIAVLTETARAEKAACAYDKARYKEGKERRLPPARRGAIKSRFSAGVTRHTVRCTFACRLIVPREFSPSLLNPYRTYGLRIILYGRLRGATFDLKPPHVFLFARDSRASRYARK